MAVADDAWASLLPDLLLDIFRRLEATAVIRCAGACKPWRRAIIDNAWSLRPRPDRFNPNLLVGFFHHSSYEDVVDVRSPSPPVNISVTAVDTGHCERLSSIIPAVSDGGVDLSPWSHRILSSRDGLLLLMLRRRGSKHDELCLLNTMSRDYKFLPLPSIMEECEYTLLSSFDLFPPGARHEHGAVRILAKAGTLVLCNEDDDRLTYQVFSCGGDDGTGIWGPVQRSKKVHKGLRMNTFCRNAVVAHDGVHWLAGPQLSGCCATSTVGLDINTGRGWTTDLPSQCQLTNSRTIRLALTTSCNGRLSLLQPLPEPDHHIQNWVLDGDGDAMEWSVQHKISIDVQNNPVLTIRSSQYWNLVCPRSGFLFIMLYNYMALRINLDRRARNPVGCILKEGQYDYYPYEMDWSTYISNMKNL